MADQMVLMNSPLFLIMTHSPLNCLHLIPPFRHHYEQFLRNRDAVFDYVRGKIVQHQRLFEVGEAVDEPSNFIDAYLTEMFRIKTFDVNYK